MMRSRAVFFDRDHTLIEDPGYISDPDNVRLYDDVVEALKRLGSAGYRLVVVTNQSGVARGILTEERLGEIHQRLEALLEQQGAGLDAIYACPYLDGPEATVEAYRCPSDLRKPAPGMLLQAAADLELDLAHSWLIGDRARDIEAGRRAGCRTILLERDQANPSARQANPDHVVRSLTEAADTVLRSGEAERMTVRGGAAQVGKASMPRSGANPPSEETVRVLSEIRDLLDRGARRRRQQDFSLVKLAATLMQLLAVLVALWGLAVMASDAAAATARFGLAIFLQLAVLSAWLADRRE
jgi:D-glycero-D-manno-heptose 1,7-bisphosphate phosphatase